MPESERDVPGAWIDAGKREDLEARGMTVVQGSTGPLLVICATVARKLALGQRLHLEKR